jgi:hypothetical protein
MSLLSGSNSSDRPVVIVRCTAPETVILYVNGFDATSFEPNEFYEVPRHIASSMIDRGWARVITEADLREVSEKEQHRESDAVLDMTKIKKED